MSKGKFDPALEAQFHEDMGECGSIAPRTSTLATGGQFGLFALLSREVNSRTCLGALQERNISLPYWEWNRDSMLTVAVLKQYIRRVWCN
jgi:hypothetical protein